MATEHTLTPETFARRLWRRTYWLPRDFLLWARLGFPQHLIYFGGRGYGDTLLLNSVAHELHRRGRRTAVLTDHPDLLSGSPAVSGVLGLQHWRALEATTRFGGEARHLPYFLRPQPPTHDEPADTHILAEMCRRVGITGEIAVRTYLHLTGAEREGGAHRPRQAALQALGTSSENLSPLKVYPAEELAKVVAETKGELDWVQLGHAGDPRVPGTLDLRGRTTVRQSAAVLAHSRLFLGPAGFLMHLARAVECRSVVIFGGRELPRHGGDSCNENLFAEVACAPCYRRSDCLDGMLCMRRIGSGDVVAAVRRASDLHGQPLTVDRVVVPTGPVPFPLPWLVPPS
jgi:hypothetical protein